MLDHFTLVGRVVEHRAAPQFRARFDLRPDGSVDGEILACPIDTLRHLGDPAATSETLARLMREAGEFFRAHVRTDWVQQIVAARARELGMTAYRIAKETGGAVSQDHVRAYLSGEKSMGSHKLQHVLRVLGLDVRAD